MLLGFSVGAYRRECSCRMGCLEMLNTYFDPVGWADGQHAILLYQKSLLRIPISGRSHELPAFKNAPTAVLLDTICAVILQSGIDPYRCERSIYTRRPPTSNDKVVRFAVG